MTTQKLDPEFKAQWIAALRSGEYKQGHCKMYNPTDSSYCCLGVAYQLGTGSIPPEYGYIRVQWPGFPSILLRGDSNEPNADIAVTLAAMNDGFDHSRIHNFSEIADWIEEHL
jgi:hypothetical protein